jgi:hypothetical protein
LVTHRVQISDHRAFWAIGPPWCMTGSSRVGGRAGPRGAHLRRTGRCIDRARGGRCGPRPLSEGAPGWCARQSSRRGGAAVTCDGCSCAYLPRVSHYRYRAGREARSVLPVAPSRQGGVAAGCASLPVVIRLPGWLVAVVLVRPGVRGCGQPGGCVVTVAARRWFPGRWCRCRGACWWLSR